MPLHLSLISDFVPIIRDSSPLFINSIHFFHQTDQLLLLIPLQPVQILDNSCRCSEKSLAMIRRPFSVIPILKALLSTTSWGISISGLPVQDFDDHRHIAAGEKGLFNDFTDSQISKVVQRFQYTKLRKGEPMFGYQPLGTAM